MGDKRLSNSMNPMKDSDVSTKAFVLRAVEYHCLILQDGEVAIYAKGTWIGKAAYPTDPRNVVIQRYL